ncbi:MAG: DUF2344 domain-containing protein, partial [Cyanobacteria bacterium J06649_4]
LLAMSVAAGDRQEAGTTANNSEYDWQALVQQVWATEQILYTKTTKSGKQKEVNLRSHLFDIAVVDPHDLTDIPENVRDRLLATGQTVIRYIGSCRNDGTLLRPSGVVSMMESIGHQTLTLGHIHRVRLILNV